MRKSTIATLSVTAILGGGIFMSPASAATFVYVGNSDSQDVTVLELKANGDLTPVATTAVPGPAKPGALAADGRQSR